MFFVYSSKIFKIDSWCVSNIHVTLNYSLAIA